MLLLIQKTTALFMLILLLLCNGMQYFAAPWFEQQSSDDVTSVLTQLPSFKNDGAQHPYNNKKPLPPDSPFTDAEDKSQFSLTPSRFGYSFTVVPLSTLLPLPDEQVLSQVEIEPFYRPPRITT